MQGPRRGLAARVAISMLVLSVVAPPAATAQGDCALVTVDEVQTVFGVTGTELSAGTPHFCRFYGPIDIIYLNVEPERTLDEIRVAYPDATDTTVGERQALSLGGTHLYIGLDGQVMDISARSGSADYQVPLAALAELVIPRVPPGPSAEDGVRHAALIPESMQPALDNVLAGDAFFVDREVTPSVQAFFDALTAQGKTTADLVIRFANASNGDTVDVVLAFLVPGADASSLLEPFAGALMGSPAAEVAPAELGGKGVLKMTSQSASGETVATYGYAVGDLAVLASGSDEFLAEYFAALPQ